MRARVRANFSRALSHRDTLRMIKEKEEERTKKMIKQNKKIKGRKAGKKEHVGNSNKGLFLVT